MKPLSFLFLALLSVSFCSAQIDSFNLNQIHNPDFQRRVLEFDVELNHSFDNAFEGVNSSNDFKGTEFRGDFSPRYRSVKNTDAYQGSQNLNLGFSRSNEDETSKGQSNTTTLNTGTMTNIYYSSQNRIYTSESMNEHVVLNPSATVEYSLNTQLLDNVVNGRTTSRRNERINMVYRGDIGYGFGRLENISDARIVLFILEELKKKGLLNRTPTEDDINALSNLAIYVKNQRFFDARIKRIYELSAMDSLIKERGISSSSSVAYHTILQDNWNYAIKPFRQTGKLFQFGLTPSFFRSWTNRNQSTEGFIGNLSSQEFNSAQNEIINLAAFLQYDKFNAISATLQNNIILRAETGVSNSTVRTSLRNDFQNFNQVDRDESYFYTLSARDEFGIYPISRTYLEFSGFVNYNFVRSLPLSSSTDNFFGSGLSVDAYYYFSPQLRLSSTCFAQYSYSNDRFSDNGAAPITLMETNNISTSIFLKLTYKLL